MTAAFRTSLSDAGDVTMEYRWAEGRLEGLPELAGDLVRRRVSVIFAGGGSEPALAAKAATSEIPIVFATGADPVGVGLVASLNRPGGNVTGITFLLNTLGPKELEVLHELQPKAADIAVLLNPNLATAALQSEDVRIAARTLGLKVHVFHASTDRDIESVFAALDTLRAGGLLIGADAFLFSRRDQLVALAARYAVPTVYPWREAVLGGGLLSYGASVTDAYRTRWHLHRAHSQGGQTGLLAGPAVHKDRVRDQPEDCQGSRPRHSPTLVALADEVIE